MTNRTSNQLSSRFVETIKDTGMFLDGDGLYLQVKQGVRGINKSWIFRYRINGKTTDMGFGSQKDVTLKEARLKLQDARRILLSGNDPLILKNEKYNFSIPTFWECCQSYINAHSKDWKSPKSKLQWHNTLKNDAKRLSEVKVNQITTPMILQVLQPIWNVKNDTARKIRGRIETILDYAKSLGFREGDNPARFKGHLEYSLSSKSIPKKNQPALHWSELPIFIKELRSKDCISSLALEFLILTATRTTEVIHAEWSEINFEEKRWTIPSSRMKANREHTIPLSSTALDILKKVEGMHSKWIFPNFNKPLSNMAMLQLLRGMNVYCDQISKEKIVVHGFRSTFRTWGAEQTNYSNEILERALAHNNPNKVEAAYLRSPQFQNRINLMESYARVVNGNASNKIIPFRSVA